MRFTSIVCAAAAAAAAFALTAGGALAATTNAPAPAFSGVDSNGVTRSLADYAGKTVILEWTNHDCPYVKKHYNGQNMQGLQSDMTADDIVWLSVISSAPGKQGYVTAEQANELTVSRDARPTAVILDPEGAIGRAYDAKTTPHMYIVTPDQKLVYQGAIDNRASASPASLIGATNHVREAMAELKAGQAVSVAETTPYGCSVKY